MQKECEKQDPNDAEHKKTGEILCKLCKIA